MSALRNAYRVVRSILFASVIAIAVLFLVIYIVLSLPGVQDSLRARANKELTAFFKAPVHIGRVEIFPFNELRLSDVVICTPGGKKCVSIGRLGAGVALWPLILDNMVEVTYAELIELDGRVWQEHKDGPLNIQFIIDAFAPKEPGKPPATFDIDLRNIVIRKSSLSFDRLWKERRGNLRFDPDHIKIENLRADVAIPRLSNDEYEVKLRRLSFREHSGLYVDALSFYAKATPRNISIRDFSLKLTDSNIHINDLDFNINGFASIGRTLREANYDIRLQMEHCSPADFAFIMPELKSIGGYYDLNATLDGTPNNMTIRRLTFDDHEGKLLLNLEGNLKNLTHPDMLEGSIAQLRLKCAAGRADEVMSLFPKMPQKIRDIVKGTSFADFGCKGLFSLARHTAAISSYLETGQGILSIDGDVKWQDNGISGDFKLNTSGFELGALIVGQPVGFLAADASGSLSLVGKDLSGNMDITVPTITVGGNEYRNISLTCSKKGGDLNAHVVADSPLLTTDMTASFLLDGASSAWNIDVASTQVNTASLGLRGPLSGILSLGSFSATLTGNSLSGLAGMADINGLKLDPVNGKNVAIKHMRLDVEGDDSFRNVVLSSDMADANVSGTFSYRDIPAYVVDILSYALPAYIKSPSSHPGNVNMTFSLNLKPDDAFYGALNAGFRPVEDVTLSGSVTDGRIMTEINAPYLLKGRDKLWRNTSMKIEANRDNGMKVSGTTELPVKNGYMNANVRASALANVAGGNLSWTVGEKGDRGSVNVGLNIQRDVVAGDILNFEILDSDIVINGAKWDLSPAQARLSDNTLVMDSLHIGHDNQFLTISGKASASPADSITATLQNIDLAYIFNTLNINYVTFGGIATGKAVASELFRRPKAVTRGLHVKNFCYNGALLGDADLVGRWNPDRKAVGLYAYITHDDKNSTTVDGNIYVVGDSLNLKFDAHKINLALVKPFMANILEDISGKASGKLRLYGTFKDITLVGKAYADSASVKVGYTNVRYHGADSVLFYVDRIHIPGFRVYDRYGNSGKLSGDITHDYFHNANIDLNISDVSRLLSLDTDWRANHMWWGTVFASGYGRIWGRPGVTMLSFNVKSDPGSSFTYSLDETQTATNYNFLTFIDSKKQAEAELSVTETLEEKYSKKKKSYSKTNNEGSVFEIDMAVELDPDIKVNVIMDPSAGDKISAVGNGAMRLNYNSFSENLNVYGRYVIDNGHYRFSFQDIILRDFKIKPGSSVSFNGNPMQAVLDLTAGYRVNTSLTDLDKSFANDPELNRSSVPVEAILKVSGNLTTPDIGFDISLPTLTSDVERKVRSIVSSDEMMSQQVLYLLALNRFYTPQFAGQSEGELVSVASSTLSSQVANVLSQITDRIALNPSFKSDRNDFSDMEVDLALSSQLFDNRLIINGNLGYRDRSVSQSTFIGDFDLEYLLSRNGQLRLKAYSHFNDAYYYLKSALTTQGLGIIYRKDFDDPFAFLKHRRKKKIKNPVTTTKDTIEKQAKNAVQHRNK